MTDYYSQLDIRRRRRNLIIAGSALVAMLAVVAFAATQLSTKNTKKGSKLAQGTISLANRQTFTVDGATLKLGATCHGTGNYTDIDQGGTVTINDVSGNPLASTGLQAGTVDVNNFCEFAFQVNVPQNRGPYGVQVTRRTSVSVSESDLFTHVTLTLGNT
ncbi:MAG: hypothetical protein M3O28_11730 [Actinomycetota bacterium]|nr:hypothetical protein [Actinomycetota bacterium]